MEPRSVSQKVGADGDAGVLGAQYTLEHFMAGLGIEWYSKMKLGLSFYGFRGAVVVCRVMDTKYLEMEGGRFRLGVGGTRE